LNSNSQDFVSSKNHFLFVFSFISSILSYKVETNFRTSSLFLNFFIFHQTLCNSALNFDLSKLNSTNIFQDSCGLKFFISFSFSTINLTATDCTLQADNHFLIFFQSTGLTLNQTSLSRSLLAC
jgi:hypothetical protein